MTKQKFGKKKRRKRISPPAGDDQRPTALDSCRLLKKAGENFPDTVVGKCGEGFYS
jgi:hypothetical protein